VDFFPLTRNPLISLPELAFIEARTNGKTRLIGVTGHHDPKILEKNSTKFKCLKFQIKWGRVKSNGAGPRQLTKII
jgi:hypothetical protein